VPTHAKHISDDDGIGGGPDARGVVVCPDGYLYLGKMCSQFMADDAEPTDFDQVKAVCDPDMTYYPNDPDQSVIFRHAMLDKYSDRESNHSIWMGVRKTANKWMTMKGDELDSLGADWAENEPDDNDFNKECAVAIK